MRKPASKSAGVLLVTLALLVLGSTAVVRAGGEEVSVTDCADLQAALSSSTEGDVVLLAEGLVCVGSFNLPSTSITLQGAGNGATLDGTAEDQRILTGSNVGTTVIRNLVFQNGLTDAEGGAIHINGASAPTLADLHFRGNSAQVAGGAVYIEANGTVAIEDSTFGAPDGNGPCDAGPCNYASGAGGGFFILASDNVRITNVRASSNGSQSAGAGLIGGGGGFIAIGGDADVDVTVEDSVFTQNTAEGTGGGLAIHSQQSGGDTDVTLTGNVITANSVDQMCVKACDDLFGGGLSVFSLTGGDVFQSGNVIDGNSVGGDSANRAGFGGGEWTDRMVVTSVNDRITNNTVAVPSSDGGSEGGGLGVVGDGSALTAQNLVVAGNQLNAVGEGAGIYVGQSMAFSDFRVLGGWTPVPAALFNSTVSGNAGSLSGAGISGGPTDTLALTNSIVWGNTADGAASDVEDGFATVVATYSDVCDVSDPTTPMAGVGNICEDPLLVNPSPGVADVHQTPLSPTIDAGSNALVPPGLDQDYEGDARIQDGDGDGSSVVDMGADELAAAGTGPTPGAGSPSPTSSTLPDTAAKAAAPSGTAPVTLALTAATLALGAVYVRRRLDAP